MTADVVDQQAAPPSGGDERLSYRGPIQRLFTRPEIGALIGMAAIWVFFWAVGDVFGTTAGTNNYLDVSAALGIMAVAVSMLMIGGEFDLSAGAITGATGGLLVLLVKDTGEFGGAGLPLIVALPITLAFALGIGWLNGTLVERTGLPSFIVTLGSFFVLRGAKLGFSKMFTDKVIVEGLNDASDYDVFRPLFGSTWIRNDHLWDSFLGGRDVAFAVLMAAGVVVAGFGLLELTSRRKETRNPAGAFMPILGVAIAAGGLAMLTRTDGVGTNWTYAAVLGLGLLVAAFGTAQWRYEPAQQNDDSLALSGVVGRTAGFGVGAVVLGILAGVTLSSTSQTVVGFLLTVQGLRAILFGGLGILGVIALALASQRAKGSPITQFALTIVTSVAIVAIAFAVQSEALAPKFRATLFAWLIMAAWLWTVIGIVRLRFMPRSAADPAADRFGKFLAIAGIAGVAFAVLFRLLWTTTDELAGTTGNITYRVSVLYFLIFAVIASWVLMRTKFGSWTFAVGGNKAAARQVGVPAARTKTSLFMLVSGAGWLVGTLTAFRLNSVQANVGDGQEFIYIIAAVVGGNLLTGGYGSVIGGAIGALIIAMSFQGIPFSGWNSDWRWLFVGVILLLSVLVNNYVRAKAEAAA